MKKNLFKKIMRLLISGLLLCLAILTISASSTFAQFRCSDIGRSMPKGFEYLVEPCNQGWVTCEPIRMSTETLGSCKAPCGKIGRRSYCLQYKYCVNRPPADIGGAEQAFIDCHEACDAKTYEPPRDCIAELAVCCDAARLKAKSTTT